MHSPSTLLPSIAVSPAPYEHLPSPPLTTGPSASSLEDNYFDRPLFLTPPPHISPRQADARLPLSSSKKCQGLDRDYFENLLKASRERNVIVGSKKDINLRKEVALKVHRGKQEERRARFLAKIGEAPSPNAINLPVTPPESPALFHFTLPSPGLVSPLALFETLGSEAGLQPPHGSCWVEQVYFHVRQDENLKRQPNSRRPSLPSLDDISSHFNIHNTSVSHRPRAPLPAFLCNRKLPPTIPAGETIPSQHLSKPIQSSIVCHSPSPVRCGSNEQTLEITTSVVPRTSTTSPTALTEANLLAFEQRAKASRGLNTLKRRVSSDINKLPNELADDRRGRRFSAPPRLFCHDDTSRIIGGF